MSVAMPGQISKHLRPDENPNFSQGVVHNGVLYIAGTVGSMEIGSDGVPRAKGKGDVGKQAQQIFDKMDAIMAEAGTNKSNILSMNTYLKDIANDYAGFNKVR